LWPWSYGSCIYNYLCNQYLSPLMLWARLFKRWLRSSALFNIIHIYDTFWNTNIIELKSSLWKCYGRHRDLVDTCKHFEIGCGSVRSLSHLPVFVIEHLCRAKGATNTKQIKVKTWKRKHETSKRNYLTLFSCKIAKKTSFRVRLLVL
jgi:hypothetical protein